MELIKNLIIRDFNVDVELEKHGIRLYKGLQAIDEVYLLRNEKVIVFHTEFYNSISNEVRLFFIFHEIGHFLNDKKVNINKFLSKSFIDITDANISRCKEYLADFYALVRCKALGIKYEDIQDFFEGLVGRWWRDTVTHRSSGIRGYYAKKYLNQHKIVNLLFFCQSSNYHLIGNFIKGINLQFIIIRGDYEFDTYSINNKQYSIKDNDRMRFYTYNSHAVFDEDIYRTSTGYTSIKYKNSRYSILWDTDRTIMYIPQALYLKLSLDIGKKYLILKHIEEVSREKLSKNLNNRIKGLYPELEDEIT